MSPISELRKNAYIEIAVALLLATISLAFFWSSLELPAPRREPLGSAAVPQIVCGCILVFCGLIALKAARVLRTVPPAAEEARVTHRRRGDLAFKLMALTLIIIAVLQTRVVPNEILTPAYLMISMLVLNEFRRAAWIPSLLLALGIGLVTDYLFTDFFYIDLP